MQCQNIMQHQNIIKNIIKQTYRENYVECIYVPFNGKITSHLYELSDLDNNKYSLTSLVLNNNFLLAIYYSNMKINKIASEIIGKEVGGPIIFMLFDELFTPVNMSTSVFRSLVYKQINIRKLLLLFEIFTKYVNKDIGRLIYTIYSNVLRNLTIH